MISNCNKKRSEAGVVWKQFFDRKFKEKNEKR